MARRRHKYKRRQSWSPYQDARDNGCCGTPALMSCATCGSFYTIAFIALTTVLGMLGLRSNKS